MNTQHDRIARLTRQGWTIARTLPDGSIVLERKKRMRTILHVVMTILTGGIWLVVVALRLANRKTETQIVGVDA